MKVLVIVDMLNAFAHKDGSLYFPDAEKIIPFVLSKIKEAYKKGYHIIFLCDAHAEDDKEFERFPKHAVEDTWEAHIVDEILNYIKEIMATDVKARIRIINKTRFSGFYKTILDNVIATDGIADAEFIFAGVCTGICDTDTIGDFANRDMKTAIYKDGVADLPNAAYGIEDCNMSMNDIMLARMAFVYGTKILD